MSKQVRQDNNINDDSIQMEHSQNNKKFDIPLMSKKMNSIEKHVRMFSMPLKNHYYHNSRPSQVDLFNDNSRLVYGGKMTPDYEYTQAVDSKAYVKHSPLKDFQTQQKLNLLQNMQSQYQRLKIGMSNRQPYLSKHSLPMITKQTKQSKEIIIKKPRLNPMMIKEELKKSMVKEKDKIYFADLYLMKKERDKIRDSVSKGISPEKKKQTDLEQQQAFIIDQKNREMKQKKQKMIKNKAMNWGVYYETFALSKSERQKLKKNKLTFIQKFYGS